MTEALTRRGEKVVAFVVARLSSSRFPAKHLRVIGDKRIIDWTIGGLKQSRQIDQIVIATVAEPENEPLRQIALDEQVEFFWYEGEVDHVTTRLRKAAEAYDADICLLISGDCPLIHGPLIDHLVRDLKSEPDADFVQVSPDKEGNAPVTEGIGVYRKSAWQRGDDLSDRPELKEHQFPIISRSPEIFTPVHSILPPECYGVKHRLSVDTRSDLEFMNEVYRELEELSRPFALPEVIRLINNNESLRQINAHVYQRRLVERLKKALFVVDAGGPFGYGHLMRCIELGHQMVERISSPIRFMVDDPRAQEILGHHAIPALWGALGREANRAPGGTTTCHRVPEDCDLLILDVSALRAFPEGWRKSLHPDCTVIVLDNLHPWVAEADLVCIPGVTCPDRPEMLFEGGVPDIRAGKEYVILRQPIRSAAAKVVSKDIDLLAYLHRGEDRSAVREFAERSKRHIHVVEGFQEDFPELLARSRCYLGNFGYGFYEALALGAYPVNWPISDEHDADALLFYRRMGLAPMRVTGADDLSAQILPLLQTRAWEGITLTDGTPAIVQAIHDVMKTREAEVQSA